MIKTKKVSVKRLWTNAILTVKTFFRWLVVVNSRINGYYAPVLSLTAIVFILILVHKFAYEYAYAANNNNPYRGMSDVKFAPKWFDGNMAELAAINHIDFSAINFIDKDTAEKIAKHYEDNIWVEKVEKVEKDFNGNLQIAVRIRKPFAVLETAGKYYIVDKNGAVLSNGLDRGDIYRFGLPVIVGAEPKEINAGALVKDGKTKAALAILREYERSGCSKLLSIEVVNVKNIGKKLPNSATEVVLWTKNNIEIQWGRSPNTVHYGEPTVQEKLDNLKTVLDSVPDLYGLKKVKIQHHRPYVVAK